MSILITRPEHDPTTKYISCWSQIIIDLASSKGITVFDLKKESANRKELVGRIKKLNPAFVILNGHGNDTSVTGHNNETLIQSDDNEHLLYSRITYALSCNSAAALGVAATQMTATTYIGYNDEFIFSIDRRKLLKPLEDQRAKPFMEASNQVAISLLKGHTATEASRRSKKLFKKNYSHLLSSTSDPDALQDAQFLWWNMTHQTCLGDGEATI